MTDSLPAAPSLEQLRKQAKELVRAHRAGQTEALARVGAHHPEAPAVLKLAGAQLVLAREHGFASWPRLRAYVERLQAHGPALEHAYHEDLEYYEDRAQGLLASATDGTPEALAAFTALGAPLTSGGARLVVARRHGLRSWPALTRHVAGLPEDGEPFLRAYRALERRDPAGLGAELDRFPWLVHARGTNGNDLLGMAGASGDARLTELLLERGADVRAANAHGWTALHQAAYANRPDLARRLLAAGASASTSARGDGGTPLVVALFWGHQEVAAVLAAVSLEPGNLRVAAGLGRAELIERLVARDGRLAPAAGAHRAFYRPHGGFPAWAPSEEPAEILGEAMAWAARSDRTQALDMLVERGAPLQADVYRGTPLVWAAACGRLRAVQKLLELGADPNRQATFGGPGHGQAVTALHLAASDGNLEVIEALLAAGADPAVRDGLFDSPPASWARHSGHEQAAARLERATP